MLVLQHIFRIRQFEVHKTIAVRIVSFNALRCENYHLYVPASTVLVPITGSTLSHRALS